MTYTEAVAIQGALEAAMLSGAGKVSFTIGDRTMTYGSADQISKALAEVNRSIIAYERRASNLNPSVVRPSWN